MRVDVSQLNVVGLSADYTFHEVSLEGPLPEGSIESLGPIDARIRLIYSGEGFVAHFEVEAEARGVCSRCNKPASLSMKLEFTEEYKEAGAGVLDDTGDAEPFTYEGEEIDFSEAIRQNLLVNLPMKMVCREDCPGLCPACGQSLDEGDCGCDRLEIDSRWEALKKLKGTGKGGENHGGSEEENIESQKGQEES